MSSLKTLPLPLTYVRICVSTLNLVVIIANFEGVKAVLFY